MDSRGTNQINLFTSYIVCLIVSLLFATVYQICYSLFSHDVNFYKFISAMFFSGTMMSSQRRIASKRQSPVLIILVLQ
jgi:hypothetical protein